MNLSKTQEIIYGLEEFQNSLYQITDQFHKMKEEFIKGIEEVISFVNKWKQRVSEEKIKQEKLSINLQFRLVSQNYQQFQEQLQKQLSKISKYMQQFQEKISSINPPASNFTIEELCNQEGLERNLILKDDLIKQEEDCLAISFNQSGTIMASGCGNKIKMWDFNNLRMKEITTLDPNQLQIMSLIFSKNSNSFLSGSTNSINMWYTKNDQSWENINVKNNGGAYCIILNSKETKLYTGGTEQISVWDINFENQKLLFSLKLLLKNVYSFSLNEKETYLITCCADRKIHVWEIKLKTIQLYQIIDTNQLGYKICFINNTDFIWLPAEQRLENCIYLYDLQNGYFQQQEEKKIHLLQENSCYDSLLFPIVFNKEREIIAVRHKISLYILQILSNGKLKIISQQKLNTYEIYGTMTNDGSTLVIWDKSSMKYQIYEIQIK